MVQQLSMSIGVGIGALILHVALVMRGGGVLAAPDFIPAFVVVGVISVSSVVQFLRLPPEAGAEVSGQRGVSATQRAAN